MRAMLQIISAPRILNLFVSFCWINGGSRVGINVLGFTGNNTDSLWLTERECSGLVKKKHLHFNELLLLNADAT